MDTAIVGMGLIGGSFYKAARAAGHRVVGLHHGDSTGGPLGDRPLPADVVLVCLPPEHIVPWIREHATSFRNGAIVVDICGVKRAIVGAMREARDEGEDNKRTTTSFEDNKRTTTSFGDNKRTTTRSGEWWFVGGHPMAGREVSGFANSKADLFVGASMILTPYPDTPKAVVERLSAFFATLGFHETVVTTPERHDDMIAFTSQLCHVIATTYSRDPRVKDAVGFSAGSYANMTRIATQDADTWSSLYLANSDALVGVLDDFAARFKELRDAVASGDVATMKRLIDEGTKAKRQELLDRQRGDER